MFESLSRILSDLLSPSGEGPSFALDDPHVAAAALMVHVIALDGTITASEADRLRALLRERHGLDDDATDALVDLARRRNEEAVDISEFTVLLRRKLDRGRLVSLMAALWELAAADGVVREVEDDTVSRMGEMLGLSAAEIAAARPAPTAGAGMESKRG